MVLPAMAALRAAESDPLVYFVDQLYSNDGQTELRESNNCLQVNGLFSTWSRSLPKGRLCFRYRAFSVWKRLDQQVLWPIAYEPWAEAKGRIGEDCGRFV